MPTFEDWTTFELADYLTDNEVYNTIESALMTDRSDLLQECRETYTEKQ